MVAPRFCACSSSSRIVVALAHRLHRAEARHAERNHRGFRAAADHDVRVIALDVPERFSDGVAAGGTGGDQPEVGAAGAVTDRNITGGQVADHHRDQQRRNLARAAFLQDAVLIAHRLQSADAAGNDHADAVRIDAAAAQLLGETGHFHCFVTGGDCVLAEKIQPLRLFGGHVFGDVEVLDFTGDPGAVFRSVEAGDFAQTATAVYQRIPEVRQIIADARNHAATGNYYPTIVHNLFYLLVTAVPRTALAAPVPPAVPGNGLVRQSPFRPRKNYLS